MKQGHPPGLDHFQWYSQFHHYSRPRRPDDPYDMDDELGPDGELVPEVLGMIIMPRLKALIEGGALNPYSMTDVGRLRDLADEMGVFIPKDHASYQVRLQLRLASEI